MKLELPTLRSFAFWLFANNVVGASLVPTIDYLTDGWFSALPSSTKLAIINGLPLFLSVVKSTVIANFRNENREMTAEEFEKSFLHIFAALIMQGSNTVAVCTESEMLDKLNQSGPLLTAVAYGGGHLLTKIGTCFTTFCQKPSANPEQNADLEQSDYQEIPSAPLLANA